MFSPVSTYPTATLESLLELGMQSPVRLRRRIPAGLEVEWAPLRSGSASLAAFGEEDGWPEPTLFGRASHLLTLHGVRIHSAAGIVITEDGQAIAETLQATTPQQDGYALPAPGRIALPPPRGRLQGTWLSLLLGGPDDDDRVLILNLGRLALLDVARAGLAGVLIPARFGPVHREAARTALHLAFGPGGPPADFRMLLVEPGEGLEVERLLLAWDIGGEDWVNPLGAQFLRPLCLPGAPTPGQGRRIYLDRRSQAERPLLNEDEVVAALRGLGIEPVRLEGLGFNERVRLFSQSELIVGAHHPGLAHLVFAAPGASLFEIRPNQHRKWHYRTLSAAAGVAYDCILSRSVPQTGTAPADLPSVVSAEELHGALERHLEGDLAAV